MKAGDRVRLDEGGIAAAYGTVEAASHAGYVRVRWDEGYTERYSPLTVLRSLRVVTGAEALPRHRWSVLADIDENPPCAVCGEVQTDDNEFAPCPGAKRANE